jgi:hypothetical protein
VYRSEIPIAIYKLVATGFPVCQRVLREVSIRSETGLEHAVAAPRTVANSSTMPSFSGPLIHDLLKLQFRHRQ